ncbi:inhibin alpha chain [Latimeria chalumnae]|uniref:Inhibin alpha chain n=1 Tax=Latimeria chalumnae TaxID=7897 RepID=H3B686_LATCH|nr:PREDICTED: inhibin alpha chain [Latimeria chalumnae]|eukprot:XP_005991833.2 PREDICTED: inhibin alpha chain [Latimeria chalumnae]
MQLKMVPFLVLMLCVQECVCTCSHHEVDKPVLIMILREHILRSLGMEGSPSAQGETRNEMKGIHKRHVGDHQTHSHRGRPRVTEDTSQVILFPTTDVPCEFTQLPQDKDDRDFTYLFQPSAHSLDRVVTNAHMWFYVGPSDSPSGQHHNLTTSPAELLILSQQGHFTIASTSMLLQDNWVIFRFAKPFLHYLSHKVFILQVRCSTCPCISDADKIPFIQSFTRLKNPDRSRRSSIPWSPEAVNLLQRPSENGLLHSNCHKASVNISFEELGWGNWIIHPTFFTFNYCHGTCSSSDSLPYNLGIKLCCAAVPGTMNDLRVRTTSDGGYSFKYEAVPNIITNDCACM